MVSTDFIAGISAGAVTTLVMHPLDLLKVRLQVDDFRAAAAAAAAAASPNSSRIASSSSPLLLPATTTHGRLARIFSTFTSYRDVYRGLSINLVGNTVSWGLYFGLYNEIKSVLIPPRLGNSINSSGDGGTSNVRINQQHLYLLSALLAGVTTSFLTNPLWVLKTRLLGTPRATAAGSGAADVVAGQSGHVVRGLAHILRTEGVPGSLGAGLCRGCLASCRGVCSLQSTRTLSTAGLCTTRTVRGGSGWCWRCEHAAADPRVPDDLGRVEAAGNGDALPVPAGAVAHASAELSGP